MNIDYIHIYLQKKKMELEKIIRDYQILYAFPIDKDVEKHMYKKDQYGKKVCDYKKEAELELKEVESALQSYAQLQNKLYLLTMNQK